MLCSGIGFKCKCKQRILSHEKQVINRLFNFLATINAAKILNDGEIFLISFYALVYGTNFFGILFTQC